MTTTKELTDQERLQQHVDQIAETLSNGFNEDDLNDDGEQMTGWDYLTDVLDINYTINQDRTFKGGRVLVAFGGPNIWVDTVTMSVDGYWWGSEAHASFNDNIGLDDALEELYNCH